MQMAVGITSYLAHWPSNPASKLTTFTKRSEMQGNPVIWLIAALMVLGALISFLHEPEGVQWLLLMWAH